MNLPQKAVDCDCPNEFVLQILDTLPGSVEMAACSRCGRTDLSNPLCSEDRPHDVVFHGYERYPLTDEARAWASAWPRYVRFKNAIVYLPASARFTSVEDLKTAIAAAAETQAHHSLRQILLSLGIPPSGPPASLHKSLDGFIEIWNGLNLDDRSPVDDVLDAAIRWNGPNQLATEVLARRPGKHQLAIELLSDSNEKRRDYGRFLVERFHLKGADILEVLRKRLSMLKDARSAEMYGICEVLGKMGPSAAAALPELRAAAKRIEKVDYYGHKHVTEVIQKLETDPS